MTEEIWKDVVGYEGLYRVSSLGRVKSIKRLIVDSIKRRTEYPEKILTPVIKHHDYGHVSLYDHKRRIKIKRIPRLVSIAFIPNPENKTQVNHINGIKSDNRASNLEWATPRENSLHAHRTGLAKARRGSNCNFSKLTEKQVKHIKFTKGPLLEMARKYNVSQGLISLIRNNKVWNHI